MKPGNYLFIDIGNTRIKTCLCKNSTLSKRKTWEIEDTTGLADEIANAGNILVCSVSGKNFNLIKSLLQGKNYHLVTNELLIDFVDYQSPESLGMDRVVAAIGAWKYMQRGCIVIDAGTATTIDMINHSGLFCGGVIMPGIGLMEQAFSQYTDLPEVERKLPMQWPPKSTESALQWGLAGSYLSALKEHIQKLKDIDPGLRVVATGGDGQWVAAMLEADFEIEVLDDLVFQGMRVISNKMLPQ